MLTLPTNAAVAPGDVHVTEDGQPVQRLSVVPATNRFAVLLLIDASTSMRGEPISGALAVAEAPPHVRLTNRPDPDRKLWGVYAVTPVSFLPGGNIDLYYLGLDRQHAEFDQGTANELRHSVGTRLWGKQSRVDYNFEFVYQFGTFGHGDISAWTAASTMCPR